jgi:hypothetical protein
VYGLTFRDDGRVTSARLNEFEIAATPNRVLRDILEVPSNLPIWVEEKIKSIIDHGDPNNPQALAQSLMDEMIRLRITDSIPDIRLER